MILLAFNFSRKGGSFHRIREVMEVMEVCVSRPLVFQHQLGVLVFMRL